MLKNQFITAIACALLSLPVFAASEYSTAQAIDIAYPEALLNKNFYDSPYNTMVEVSGTVSGKKFHGTLPIVGIKSVNKLAFTQVQYSLEKMLKHMPDEIKFGIIASNIKIAIIADGHGQKLTELPEYKTLPASYNDAEGVGATFETKTQSIGERNVSCDLSPKRAENVFVHEFAHVVLDIGIGYYLPSNYNYFDDPTKPPSYYNISKETLKQMRQLKNKVDNAFYTVVKKGIYEPKIYMIRNPTEYFAEGSQAYFNAQGRVDVNALDKKYKLTIIETVPSMASKFGVQDKVISDLITHTVGINTYSRLSVFDPVLFAALQAIYGKEQPWDFCADMSEMNPSCRFYCVNDDYHLTK